MHIFEFALGRIWRYVSYGIHTLWTTSEAIFVETCWKNQHFQNGVCNKKYFVTNTVLKVVFFSTRLDENHLRGGPEVPISVWNVTPFVIFWGLEKYSFGLTGVCPKWRGWSKMCGRPPILTYYSKSKWMILKIAENHKRDYVSYGNDSFCTTSEAISPQTFGKIQHFQNGVCNKRYFITNTVLKVAIFPHVST